MARAKSKPKLKPVKRNDNDIWLVGHSASTKHTTKRTSKKEVLTLFFLYKEAERKAVHEASHCATENLLKKWAEIRIPTSLKQHVVKKIEEMFEEWAKLKKN